MPEGPADAGPADAGSDRAQDHRRRPRLLVLSPDFPPAPGGIQLTVHRLVSGFTRFDTRVVTPGRPGGRELDVRERLSVTRVPAPTWLRGARNLPLNAAALLVGLRMRPDAVLSAHIVTSPAAAAIAALTHARTVQYFHAQEIGHRPRLAAFAARRADAIVSVSAYTTDLIRGLGVSVEDRIRLISPGVDLPAEVRPEPAGRPTVLTVARLKDSYKGHDVMVRALASVRERVPAVEWVVIGDGPLRAGLEELARSCGVADCVRWLGAVGDEERDRWLRRCDLLAMPSRLPGHGLAGEGFGIVYMEAAAHGKPVVAGRVGGALDAVLDGETGLLVDPTDPQAVAEAIARLLLDRELARRLGAAGAERARAYAWPRVAERVQELLLATMRPGSIAPRAGDDVSLGSAA